MNLQSLVVIALRLLALNFFLKIVVTFLPQIYAYGESFRSPDARSVTFVYLLFIAALITGACMLWSLALPLAQRITAGYRDLGARTALSAAINEPFSPSFNHHPIQLLP